MESKKISIIIPVYNMELYIDRCLNSILYNTYKNLEIICINDGSQDKSLEILLEFQKKDDRVIVLNKINGGVSSARNQGLNIVSGEYIAFIDADDWVHQRYFETLVGFVEQYELDIGICSYVWTDNFQKDKEISETFDYNIVKSEQFFLDHMMKSFLWGRLYRTEVIKELRFDESLRIGEDLLFNAKIVCLNDNLKIGFLNLKLYYYYKRESSITHSIELIHTFSMVKKLYELTNDYFMSDDLKKIYQIETIKKSMAFRYVAALSDINEVDKIENLNILSSSMEALLKNKAISKKKVSVLFLMWKFPCLYRWIRIMKDKTLLDWEKSCRQNKQ